MGDVTNIMKGILPNGPTNVVFRVTLVIDLVEVIPNEATARLVAARAPAMVGAPHNVILPAVAAVATVQVMSGRLLMTTEVVRALFEDAVARQEERVRETRTASELAETARKGLRIIRDASEGGT